MKIRRAVVHSGLAVMFVAAGLGALGMAYRTAGATGAHSTVRLADDPCSGGQMQYRLR
jgi:hypothetical protein